MTHQNYNPEAYMPFLNSKSWCNEDLMRFSEKQLKRMLSTSQATIDALQEATKAQAQYAQDHLKEMSKLYENMVTPKTNIGDLYETHTQANQSSFNKALSHNQKMVGICQDLQKKLLDEFQANQDEVLRHASEYTKKSAS